MAPITLRSSARSARWSGVLVATAVVMVALVATEQMRAIGLEVLDGGGLDDMVSAGWSTA